MRVKHKDTIIKRSGNTADIVSVVMDVYNKDWQQVNGLVRSFGSGEEACQNIFNYIIDNVHYKEDPTGVQWVKTPSRLLADKTGDCKSMSIFSASCLRALRIDHFFRFVSFNERKQATHVYVIAVLPDGRQIILDPVVRRNGQPVYNIEENYTYKSDMRGTDIYYLSGIKQSYIGEVIEDKRDRYDVWLGDRDNLSPGKISLYARLDYLIELAGITSDNTERAGILNELDLITLAIRAYDFADGDYSRLERMYFALSALVREGMFTYAETDLNWRKNNHDTLFSLLLARAKDEFIADLFDIDTLNYLTNEVLLQMNLPYAISGMWDWLPWNKAEAKLKENALYYIYIFMSDAEAQKETPALQKKRQTQLKTLKWQSLINIWHSYNTHVNFIRAGIIAKTGKTPEQVIKDMRSGKDRIGFIATVAAVISIVYGIIQLIALLVSTFGKKNDAPTEAEIKNSIFNSSDFPQLETNTGNETNTDVGKNTLTANVNKILPLALIGTFLLKLKK